MCPGRSGPNRRALPLFSPRQRLPPRSVPDFPTHLTARDQVFHRTVHRLMLEHLTGPHWYDMRLLGKPAGSDRRHSRALPRRTGSTASSATAHGFH